jgi:hypothetical protein
LQKGWPNKKGYYCNEQLLTWDSLFVYKRGHYYYVQLLTWDSLFVYKRGDYYYVQLLTWDSLFVLGDFINPGIFTIKGFVTSACLHPELWDLFFTFSIVSFSVKKLDKFHILFHWPSVFQPLFLIKISQVFVNKKSVKNSQIKERHKNIKIICLNVINEILRWLIVALRIMREWLLFNANSAIFQQYHGENQQIFNKMMMRSALY